MKEKEVIILQFFIISLKIAVLTITGPIGSGKSTLANLFTNRFFYLVSWYFIWKVHHLKWGKGKNLLVLKVKLVMLYN